VHNKGGARNAGEYPYPPEGARSFSWPLVRQAPGSYAWARGEPYREEEGPGENAKSRTVRLLLSVVWLGGGLYGIFTYLKYRAYVQNLPASPGNDALRRKHRNSLLWSIASIAIGLLWSIRLFT
jgi:hypothetical protein